MNDAPRPRGRPREFDRDQALDRAVSTFWTCGYDGASLGALTDSMGINRPSLYSTFGNKHELFMDAIDRYATTIGCRPGRSLYSEPDIRLAMPAFFAELIDCAASDNGPGGCLIANVATEQAAKDPEVRTKVARMMAETDSLIADRLRIAQNAGELSQKLDPQALARVIVAMMQCLATRARVGASRDELSALAKDFITVLFPD